VNVSARIDPARTRARWCGIALALLVSVLAWAGGPASAQPNLTAQQESVEGRIRPEFDPIGFIISDLLGMQEERISPQTGLRTSTGPIDSITIFPKVGLEVGYNDNLLKTQNNQVGDGYYLVNPLLKLQSDWDNHEIVATAELVAGRYFSQVDENYNDIKLGLAGRLDFTDSEYLSVALAHGWLHEERGTFDRNFGSRPTRFNQTALNLLWHYQRDAYLSDLTAGATYFNYHDTDAAAFADLNQDDRDRWEYRLADKIGYEFFDDTIFYVEPGLNVRRYSNVPDDFGVNRNSRGYQMLVGLTYDASSVTFLDFAVGYMWQDYEDNRLPDVSGWTARGRMLWNVTEIHTVNLDLTRSITEAITANNGGILATAAGASVDWEYLYNTIFTAGVKYTRQSQELAGGGDQLDNILTYKLGARHLLNEFSQLRFGWTYETRTSNALNADYGQNIWFGRIDFFI
jgi:hypothetical protein